MTIKICTSCNESKPLDQFWKNGSKTGGKENRCKACKSIKNKEHEMEHRRKIDARKAELARRTGNE